MLDQGNPCLRAGFEHPRSHILVKGWCVHPLRVPTRTSRRKFYEVYDAFFKELATYLTVRNLAGLLGSEVLDRPQDPHCGEYVLGVDGTVMLENKDIANGSSYRKTQFMFDLNGNQEPDPVQPGTSHSRTTTKTHRVFVSKEYGQATIHNVVQGLKEAKVLA